MILDIQGQVLQLIREGKKLHEVIAAQPTAAYDAKWTDDPAGAGRFYSCCVLSTWWVGAWRIAKPIRQFINNRALVILMTALRKLFPYCFIAFCFRLRWHKMMISFSIPT